ncbi:methyltransferase domain-containing protein [Pseudonocardia yunnanensis]|uniref:Class I SAM-dependent methyltransferase n=1 Tax=Pseudonocardia yunnanensis TaxID=58107 RepID=A0ABW4FDM4_9PSEU
MRGDPGPQLAAPYYERGREAARLDSARGRLERERTEELVQRHLPPPPATVADVGGGPGAYSLWLAASGYSVIHRDLFPLHVRQTTEAASAAGLLIDSAVADARHLDLPDDSVYAVLLLGPLYHLHDRDQRLHCWREAGRILRPGGVVFAAAISRWATLLDGSLLKRLSLAYDNFDATLDRVLATGYLDPLEPGGFAAYTHRPDEFMAEAEEAGFTAAPPVAIEGPGYLMLDVEERRADPSAWNEILDAARRVEGVPELVGIGQHLLLTAYMSQDLGDVLEPV